MTRKLPAVLPAVYSPPLVMLPPVALYVTAGAVVLPSLHTPLTANWRVAAVKRLNVAGDRITCVSAEVERGPESPPHATPMPRASSVMLEKRTAALKVRSAIEPAASPIDPVGAAYSLEPEIANAPGKG